MPPIDPDTVLVLYRRLLDREPAEAEVAHQVATMPSLDALLGVIVASEEYAHKLAAPRPAPRAPAVVNTFHPDLAAWSHQPGTRSADGVAVVGHRGHLFLVSGSNAVLDQFRGRQGTTDRWLDDWISVVEARVAAAEALGAALAMVVVPDKLGIHEDLFPEDLERSGLRPVERLTVEAGLPVSYAATTLQAAMGAGEVALRTDTHLTLHGNRVLEQHVCDLLGMSGTLKLDPFQPGEYIAAGDLGHRFSPEVVEPMRVIPSFGAAVVVEDNRAEIEAVGGHIGTRRVLRNEAAPDPRTLVLFGDSYGFGSTEYQGLSWFLAQRFACVHFVWVPFGWDPAYVERAGAELVVLQAAERFLTQVPREHVDVQALAEETVRRRRAVGIESAFDSGPAS